MERIIWCAIIIEDKRILLIKRSKNKGSIPNFWAFPWWWKENDETPEETTSREIKEELWVNLNIEKLYSDNTTEKAHFYNFLWTIKWDIVLQKEECDWYWWFTYMETTYLPMIDRVKQICARLFEEWLIE